MTRERNRADGADRGHMYRPKPALAKHCRVCQEAAEYDTGWGIQRFTGPHIVVMDPQGAYGVELTVFFATHEPVPERPGHYIKTARVRAWIATDSLTLTTEVNGRMEMVADVPPGAYVVENPSGERYPMTAEEFERRYELDEG
jgi:hypothetical protein